MNLDELAKETGIANPRQLRFLLRGGEAWKVIGLIAKQALEIAFGLLCNGRLREHLLPRLNLAGVGVIFFAAPERCGTRDQPIHAEGFLVEEDFRAQAEGAIELGVVIL